MMTPPWWTSQSLAALSIPLAAYRWGLHHESRPCALPPKSDHASCKRTEAIPRNVRSLSTRILSLLCLTIRRLRHVVQAASARASTLCRWTFQLELATLSTLAAASRRHSASESPGSTPLFNRPRTYRSILL